MWRSDPGPRTRLRLVMSLLAVCAIAAGVVAIPAAPAAAVSSPFTVLGQTVSNSNSPKSVSASCPSGSRLYGASPFIVDGLGQVTLESSIVNLTPDLALARASENVSTSQNWSLGIFAICGSSTANLQRITVTSATDSSSTKSLTGSCPTGTKLYGLGYSVPGSNGQAFLRAMAPLTSLTSATFVAVERAGFTGNWTLIGHLICANPAATMTAVVSSGPSNSDSPKDATAGCPSGTRVHGVGANLLGGGSGEVTIEDMQVTAALSSSTAKAYEAGPSSAIWSIRSFAICSS